MYNCLIDRPAQIDELCSICNTLTESAYCTVSKSGNVPSPTPVQHYTALLLYPRALRIVIRNNLTIHLDHR